jgi:hypothetical protein
MKKGKYIDNYVIMACMSHQKPAINFKGIDDLLNKVCAAAIKMPAKTNATMLKKF